MRSAHHRALEHRHLTVDLGGVTLHGLPDPHVDAATGFRRCVVTVHLGGGEGAWDFAAYEILRWGVKTRSGFTVRTSEGEVPTGPVSVGERYWLVAHLGPLRVYEPVQIVSAVDEPDRKGFSYGTLDGHPVSGEEAFVVERRPDDTIMFTNRSLTGAPSGWWRLMYPVSLLAQPLYRQRYMRSLRRV